MILEALTKSHFEISDLLHTAATSLTTPLTRSPTRSMWPHWPQQQPRPLIQWPQRFQLAERRVPRVHPPVVRQIGQIMVELIVRRVLLSSRGRMTSPASATRITKSTLAQVIYKQKIGYFGYGL